MLPTIIIFGLITAVSRISYAVLVSGGNQGQGYALCERILAEHTNSYVFLGARDPASGAAAVAALERAGRGRVGRVECVQLDVADDASVAAARARVAKRLSNHKPLYGLVSNAGVLSEGGVDEQLRRNTFGVHRLCEAFLPLMRPVGGRVVIVSPGLVPLMHRLASAASVAALVSYGLTWEEIAERARACLAVAAEGGGAAAFEAIGFGGGPFAEAALDVHMHGLSKALADAYMLTLARAHPKLFINSCGSMTREEAGAKTPAEAVEAVMRLLFYEDEWVQDSGLFFAMSKDQSELLRTAINVRPEHAAAAARLQATTSALSLFGSQVGLERRSGVRRPPRVRRPAQV